MRPVLLSLITALAAVSAASTKVVLGKVGRATADAVVYAAPSARAHGVSRVGTGTYLVVHNLNPRWATVVMQNGRYGYVPAQAVEIPTQANGLPWEYVSNTSPEPTRRAAWGTIASRGGAPRTEMDAGMLMAENAQSLIGTTPYRWGGTQLGAGIDCSGFVQKMAGRIGLNLPRTAAEQDQVGMKITRYEDLRPGDRLYFWEAKRGMIGHTGIYIGNGRFTHSSSGHHGIATDYLTPRWQRICVDARR